MSHEEDDRAIRGGRLAPQDYACNFADSHPPLTPNEALVESDRCYFCYDAPCVHACPTQIDIPSFIRKIATGNVKGAAQDILKQNIMGAVCARVCPTEVLCEGACVRNHNDHKPVKIGALQRHATDWLFERSMRLFERAADSGKRVAVVGGGPAGLSCAHRLAMLGHSVTVFEARSKLGGLNEYGVAAYKVTDDIAQREVDYLLQIGGIDIQLDQRLGRDITLSQLRQTFDAVFLGIGLGAVNALGIEQPHLAGVFDAISYIEQLRQAQDLSALPVGRSVVVIGGGMTAIDIASQTRRLGAEDVTIVYRRGPEDMGASVKEQTWAQTSGVRIKHWARPLRLLGTRRRTHRRRVRTHCGRPARTPHRHGRQVHSGCRHGLQGDRTVAGAGWSRRWRRRIGGSRGTYRYRRRGQDVHPRRVGRGRLRGRRTGSHRGRSRAWQARCALHRPPLAQRLTNEGATWLI